MRINAVVFDFGGVLIDWNPRHLYRKVFDDEEEMEWFLENVCTMDWNVTMDQGLPFAKGVKQLQEKYPDYAEHINYYHLRWPEMLKDEISGTVEILREIQEKNYPVYGLTNWSSETFPIAYDRFKFLATLDGIVVSGEEKHIKPNPEIYHILKDRFGLNPQECVFIDDSHKNIVAANDLGFKGIHFTTPEQLRKDLEDVGVL